MHVCNQNLLFQQNIWNEVWIMMVMQDLLIFQQNIWNEDSVNNDGSITIMIGAFIELCWPSLAGLIGVNYSYTKTQQWRKTVYIHIGGNLQRRRRTEEPN